MPQPGSPPLRVRVALVAACYVAVWLGGVAHLAARCPETPRPHCALCACITTAPLAAAPTLPTPILHDAGAMLAVPRTGAMPAAAAVGVTRAPPSRASESPSL
jgi:hypothetical protein